MTNSTCFATHWRWCNTWSCYQCRHILRWFPLWEKAEYNQPVKLIRNKIISLEREASTMVEPVCSAGKEVTMATVEMVITRPHYTGQLSKRLAQQLPMKRDWEGLRNQWKENYRIFEGTKQYCMYASQGNPSSINEWALSRITKGDCTPDICHSFFNNIMVTLALLKFASL